MNSETKLLLIISQLENIHELTKDNMWKEYYQAHIFPLYYETQRQLSLIQSRKFV